MDLPVMPPVSPMLAKPVSLLPAGMLYEPKWDGFRCVAFRDRGEVELTGRNKQLFTRYFPELIAAARKQLPPRCVVDGEIVVIRGPRLDFEALQQRLQPAVSRARLLAQRTPAAFVVFDLLALGDKSFLGRPFAERRAALESVLTGAAGPFYLTPLTSSRRLAERWLRACEGTGLDGVVAKRPDLPYLPDRRAMFTVKRQRTADCVVVGFRWHKSGPVVGSLLLGLYDGAGRLQHVGVTSSFTHERRRELLGEIAPYRLKAGEPHPWLGMAVPEGAPTSGWPRRSAPRDRSWEPLAPELVVEVAYDRMEGRRFRHTVQFRRWRPDRDPRSCTYAQLEQPACFDLQAILRGADPGAAGGPAAE